MVEIVLIKDQKSFNINYYKLLRSNTIYIDTEFDRKKTYYPKLSLIQIATQNDEFLIVDALSDIDLIKIKSILLNQNILKVLHDPKQDFEIFLHIFNIIPINIFDTQIAAKMCNIGNTTQYVGYANLCKELLDVEIDKKYQTADWIIRPLKPQLIEYAINDIKYLPLLYQRLHQKLKKNNLLKLYNDKLNESFNKESYCTSKDNILQKFSCNSKITLKKKLLVELLMFREESAKKLNIPRKFCATNQDILTIYKHLPTTDTQIKKLSISKVKMIKYFKNELLELCYKLKYQKK
ncbi:HRDC domain-containing protein [Rickettsia endosymbiont of Cardiosporidium cionae]|uniref:HRDC domain-containing protein n=1 Tax=Rickettsia endosymbiont of Cardiosporidium cionae TaxID=2777155 RepID=UPI00189604AF|nr:ribonuclease D [Rickettsia endosymbiont of Cardiosporidium cionae]KAF8818821.1 ribonuclease D [Rickettsia endosymbiont of Cardiosporidium cionae]